MTRGAGALCAALLALMALVTSCATTSTTLRHVWIDESLQRGPIEKILVVGVHESAMIQSVFEDHIRARFQERGIEAVRSMDVIPPDKELDREAVKAAIASGGFDAVLVTRLIGVDTQSEWIDGETYVVPRGYYNTFYGYYITVQEVVHAPGYMVESSVVSLETNIYDVASEKLIWAALSETFDPPTAGDAIESVGKALLRDLTEDGLVP